MERGILNTVSIDLADVEILLDFLDLVGSYVISYAPHMIAFGWTVLKTGQSREPLGLWKVPTVSPSVSQNLRSIKVTTLPGASGVPRWSSLPLVSGEYRPVARFSPCLGVSVFIKELDVH